MEFYERLEKLRKNKGISQGDLEKELEFSNGSISKWKKSTPTHERLQKVADYFNVSVDYLMTGKTNILFETAKQDAALSNMDDTLKKYALKLSNLTKEQQELVMKMIDQLGE